MSRENRRMLEATLFNLRYDMDCIGEAEVLADEISRLSDEELETLINEWDF